MGSGWIFLDYKNTGVKLLSKRRKHNAFASEGVAKTALVDRYSRDSFTLATKLHAAFFNSLEDRDKVFSSQLEKTGAGFFDACVILGTS